MLNTLGMSGHWSFDSTNTDRIKFTLKKSKKHDYLYFSDQRNFGTLEFTKNKNVLDKKLQELAPDILRDIKKDDDIIGRFDNIITKNGSKNIVKLLMDQKKIVSGIGNYLVAEILYDAKINPHRTLKSLSSSEKKNLAHSMRKLTKYAYYDNTTGYMDHDNLIEFMKSHKKMIDDGTFPDYHPDIKPKKFKFKVYGQKKDPKGNTVKKDNIIKDRTIHWVESVQK